jgi:hypothetical protein
MLMVDETTCEFELEATNRYDVAAVVAAGSP